MPVTIGSEANAGRRPILYLDQGALSAIARETSQDSNAFPCLRAALQGRWQLAISMFHVIETGRASAEVRTVIREFIQECDVVWAVLPKQIQREEVEAILRDGGRRVLLPNRVFRADVGDAMGSEMVALHGGAVSFGDLIRLPWLIRPFFDQLLVGFQDVAVEGAGVGKDALVWQSTGRAARQNIARFLRDGWHGVETGQEPTDQDVQRFVRKAGGLSSFPCILATALLIRNRISDPNRSPKHNDIVDEAHAISALHADLVVLDRGTVARLQNMPESIRKKLCSTRHQAEAFFEQVKL